MHQVTNPLQACNDIFIKPNAVFAALAEKHNWSWLPFFTVILMAVIPSYLYFSFVDFAWYKELIISTQYGEVSPAEQDMVRKGMTQGQMEFFTLMGATLGYIIINAIVAVYLNIVTKMDEENVKGFTDWYGFSWWVAMPVVVNSLISLVFLLLADDHQIGPQVLGATSLAFMFGLEMGDNWFNLAQAIRLDSLWSIYLIAVGVAQWTNIPAKKTYLIAVGPYAIIWGIWALVILLG